MTFLGKLWLKWENVQKGTHNFEDEGGPFLSNVRKHSPTTGHNNQEDLVPQYEKWFATDNVFQPHVTSCG